MKLILQNNLGFSEKQIEEIKELGVSIDYYNNEIVEGDIFAGFPKQPFSEVEDITGLKFVQSLMVGYDHLNLNALLDRGIIFASGSGVSSVPIAEYVLLKILDHYKKAQRFRDQQAVAHWGLRSENTLEIDELYNKTALILGTGSIGMEIAKRLQVFGVSVIGVNTTGKEVGHFDKTVSIENLNLVLKKADIVVGCLPLTKSTQGIYNYDFFSEMKSDAIFINVGRGSQLNEEDLLKVLETHLAHVYLDVLPKEPLASDSKLWSHKKVSITPHISSSSIYIRERMKDLLIFNIKQFISGQEIKNRVV